MATIGHTTLKKTPPHESVRGCLNPNKKKSLQEAFYSAI
jgi:hypothetical protein